MFILQFLIILLATKLAGQVSIRLGQPSVLGKIIIGIVIGPAMLGWIQDTEILKVFSDIGVLLLMFLAGLETNLTDLNKNKKSSLFVAAGGILFPIVGGFIGGYGYGLSVAESIFLGLILSATSVSISVQTLRELGWLQSREGSTLLGAAVIDDIVVVILLALDMSFFMGTNVNLVVLLVEKILFFVISLLISKWLVPTFIGLFSKLKVTESLLSGSLIVCFAFALFAEYLGVAGIIGTFIAGIAIGQTEYKKEVESKIESIAYGIFVPVFFASIGISVSFIGLSNQIVFTLVFSVIAIASKFVGAGLGARLSGFNTHSSMGIGAGMVSRGEVALIVIAMGLENQLIPVVYYTPMIIVVIITTLVTPPLLKVFFSK
ncbi:MAG: cation:proton antiporter [Carnobacterium sp.]|uniref:cation:proton antiporter n=1 Tax=unclassified Carnobacterium TaxID=257487 RepID=UPI001912E4F4|nr:cation:proton antiporter [Carnobacterium sp. CS13]QQP69908.1 cation:proton antiporter [Carnobacterium sp. CS13]